MPLSATQNLEPKIFIGWRSIHLYCAQSTTQSQDPRCGQLGGASHYDSNHASHVTQHRIVEANNSYDDDI